MYSIFRSPSFIVLTSLILGLFLLAACGSSATATPQPTAAAVPTATTAPGAVPPTTAPTTAAVLPTATPAPTKAPVAAAKPAGTLQVGQKELGTFQGHPRLAVNPALFVQHSAPISEGLFTINLDREVVPWLVQDWSISDDFRTWTLKLNQGVQFHKGYGELTAEDVVWSYTEGWAKNAKHARHSDFATFWAPEGGRVTAVDKYTVEVDTGKPLSSLVILETWLAKTPSGSSNWTTSKKQSDAIGEEAANRDIAGSGSWSIVEHRDNEFWRMEAVEDHWLQTPFFAELIFREIPEESARLAGFQTGQLDTFLMAFDTISEVEKVDGARLMSIPGAVEYGFNLYGGYYAELADPEVENQPAYDPEVPWISSNYDVDSEEWDRARKVRQAMAMAIDRATIIDTLLAGFAVPIDAWLGGILLEERLGDRQWPFDPDRSRALLEEAGYGDGFSITLTPSLRGAAAEVEACQAVAQMLGDVGIDVTQQNIPYSTLRPQLVSRTYQGATCHAAGVRVLAVGSIGILTTKGGWNMGASHPFLEQLAAKIDGAVDPAELQRLETEYGVFLYDNALTGIGLYGVAAVIPVGPRIESWREHVKFTDLRNINGYEYIRPRQ